MRILIPVLLFSFSQEAYSQTLVRGNIRNDNTGEVSFTALDSSFGDISKITVNTDPSGNFSIDIGFMAPSYIRMDIGGHNVETLMFPMDTVDIQADSKDFDKTIIINGQRLYEIDSASVYIMDNAA